MGTRTECGGEKVDCYTKYWMAQILRSEPEPQSELCLQQNTSMENLNKVCLLSKKFVSVNFELQTKILKFVSNYYILSKK